MNAEQMGGKSPLPPWRTVTITEVIKTRGKLTSFHAANLYPLFFSSLKPPPISLCSISDMLYLLLYSVGWFGVPDLQPHEVLVGDNLPTHGTLPAAAPGSRAAVARLS